MVEKWADKMNVAESFVKNQLAEKYWPIIPRILTTAYAAADALIKDSPILNVVSARDNRGRIVSYAVDLGFERAIQSSALDCDYRWASFDRPTGRYLQMRFSHSTASISQVARPSHQPRTVNFRENARLRRQGVLDFDEFKDELKVSGEPHFLIVHGYQDLTFAHIGLPSAYSRSEYEWRSKNLMAIPHEIVAEGPDFEDTDFDFDEMNLLKQDIEKWRRDHGDGD
jgi:Fe-S-cluster formation regulator IscX/YfhJ